MPTGTVELDFGAFPGVGHAKIAVTGQAAIASGSIVGAWLFPADTTDHKSDEHIVEPIKITVPKSEIIAGTGFTIHGYYTGPPESARPIQAYRGVGERDPAAWGKFLVAWAWV